MTFKIVRNKIAAAKIFSCSDLSEFIQSIVQILPFKGWSKSRFYMCEVQGVRFLTKLCFYRKMPLEVYGKPTKAVVPHTDAEISILKIFKEKLIDKNITPCILELVYAHVCEGLSKVTPRDKICERLMTEHDARPEEEVQRQMCEYSDLVKNGLAHDKAAFLVLEKCDMTLDDYLKKSINTPVSLAVFKSLLFQIIYTFHTIYRIYPNFHHFDLHTDNIMLKFDSQYKFKATNPKFLVYHIDGETYNVPYFGIIPKIIDFGFSSLPEEGVISNATEDRMQMFVRSSNDLLFLFHWIHHTVASTGADKLGRVDKILSALEPNRTYVHYYTEYIRKVEKILPTYENMVKNKIFDEYRKYVIPKTQIYAEYTPVPSADKK